MNCELWRGRVIELSRKGLPDAEVTGHIDACPECGRFFDEQRALTGALQEVARSETAEPPASLEAFLVGEFEAARVPRRRYGKHAAVWGAIAAAAAGFALLHSARPRVEVQLPVPPVSVGSQPPVTAHAELVAKQIVRHTRRRAPKPDTESAGPFVAIPYTLPLDPREPVAVMRIAMPVTALVAIGLAGAAPDPTAVAQADALVSEDGRIRALRLVSFGGFGSGSDRRTNP